MSILGFPEPMVNDPTVDLVWYIEQEKWFRLLIRDVQPVRLENPPPHQW